MSNLTQTFSTIKTFFEEPGYQALLKLKPEERIFAYHMSQAALSGYQITLFQFCPYPEVITKISNAVSKYPDHQELIAYWIYLFSNYGVHCHREHSMNKKTPEKLGLHSITPDFLKEICIDLSADEERYLFDMNYCPTFTISNSIEESGGNFYGSGMTTELYETLPMEKRSMVNGYHYLNQGKIETTTYSLNGICSNHIQKIINWLEKAMGVAKNYPDSFDRSTVKSLEYLITYLTNGDENDFREHCKEWLKMNNPGVEYCLGFIEYYDDPMSHVGTFEADVTVKAMKIDNLIKLLPTFEERFPFPQEWKRKDMSIIPNAAVAHKTIGIGGLGPTLHVIAHCLPNYDDIRSEFGSKQVMFTLPSSSKIEQYKKLYLQSEDQEVYNRVSPDLKLESDVANLCTTLHETIGHASGSLVDGLSNEIKLDRLKEFGNGLEEMRAEILALYTATHFYQEIIDSGILGDWPEKVSKEKMFEYFVQHVAGRGWARWQHLPEGETKITQAHVLADTGIMYYLIDHSDGNLTLNQDAVEIDDQMVERLYLHIKDVMGLLPLIAEMAFHVQKMASTAIPEEVGEFMNQYSVTTRDPRYSGIVKGMRKAIKGNIVQDLQIFPELVPIMEDEEIVDIEVKVPNDAFEAIFQMWNSTQR